MRPYLVDFLIEAHAAFQLLPETLFLAVNLLDRYCSKRVVYKRHYQLVGCASLLIAAKYGDRKDRVPIIRELKSMCCNLYDEDMFTQMEWHVLNTLGWIIGHPTVDTWMQLILKEGVEYDDDVEVEHMSWYLCEIALYHKEFVSTKPSVMAHASIALARGILGRRDILEDSNPEVSQIILELSRKLDRPSQVLFRKYSYPHMSRVSLHLDEFLRQQEALNRFNSPPTPPCEMVTKQPELYPHPGTPQKPYGAVAHGYMTPPITPDGEFFLPGNENKAYLSVPRCPVTPTPSSNPYVQQQYRQQYHHTDLMQ